MSLTSQQQKIVDLALTLVNKALIEAGGTGQETGSCWYCARAVVEAAKKYDKRLVLRAGSAYWERLTPAQDDGVAGTHFGYVWEPNSYQTRLTISRMKAGDLSTLPEMHVWAADPSMGDVVDLTSGLFPAQAMKISGMDWPGKLPPKHFWGSHGKLDKLNAVYESHPDAIQVAKLWTV